MKETAVLTLTDFLLARIAERQKLAEYLVAQGAALVAEGALPHANGARLSLAECEAKRRIVGLGPSECSGYFRARDNYIATSPTERVLMPHYPDKGWFHCDGCASAEAADALWNAALQALALPYADHPDYREEWRP